MKHMCKNGSRLSGKRGETMVEVIIAFVLLSIILLLFSQGIAWATKAEANATNNRAAADSAMKSLQQKLAQGATGNPKIEGRILVSGAEIMPEIYIEEGGYTYVVYRVNNNNNNNNDSNEEG